MLKRFVKYSKYQIRVIRRDYSEFFLTSWHLRRRVEQLSKEYTMLAWLVELHPRQDPTQPAFPALQNRCPSRIPGNFGENNA